MEESGSLAYNFVKVLLGTPSDLRGEKIKQFGSATIEIFGRKGKMICETPKCFGYFSEKNPEVKFFGFLVRSGEKLPIGELAVDENGNGTCEWDFIIAEEKQKDVIPYKLVIMAGERLVEGEKYTDIFLEGYFNLPFKIISNKVVEIKKEAKVEQSLNRQVYGKNPHFQKVEPFKPAIPDSVWWQITVQPGYAWGSPQYYDCPRHKRFEALF